MAAYDHLLQWVDSQSAQRLRQRARKDVVYDHFFADPEKMRFQIVQLDLHVLQVTKCDAKGPNGSTLYEVNGPSMQSGSMWYMAIVEGLPPGMPSGVHVDEQATLVGYFFKLQNYYSLLSKPGARPLTAPVIVGRLIWRPSPLATQSENLPPWAWAALTVGGVVTCAGIGLWAVRGRKPSVVPQRMPGRNFDPEAPSVDQWLDQAQTGELTDPSGPAGEDPAEGNGRLRGNGHADLSALWLSGGARGADSGEDGESPMESTQ
jgi:hypothetical protein